jgi:cytochrome c oxidase assembly factor CtaG
VTDSGMVLAAEFPPGVESFNFGDWFAGLTDTALANVITTLTFVVFLAVAILMIFFLWAYSNPQIVPTRRQWLAESAYGFVRNTVAIDILGKREGVRFAPYLTTLFLFILLTNFFAIVPGIQISANASISFPLVLGFIAWCVYNYVGIKKHGFLAYLKHTCVPPGAPLFIYPLLVPIEFLQNLILRPVTLALRALPANRERGPREWILAVVHSRYSRFVAHPLIALAIYLSSLYVMYFTGMFEWAMDSHFGHMLMTFHFLAAGCLFFWIIIGPDPKPRRMTYPAKVLLYFVSIVFHAIFGLSLMMSTGVIAEDWYSALDLAWRGDLLDIQRTGGGIAWAFGEIPSLVVIGVLVAQWSRSEERENRRLDRIAERAAANGRPEDDPHEVYNAYLARINKVD